MRDIVIEDQQLPASEKPGYIFDTFDSLEPGDSIILISSYDPEALWSLFDEKRPSQFTLEYLLNGPEEWRVKLTKKLKENWIPLH